MSIDDIVAETYRGLLGRDADPSGRQSCRQFLCSSLTAGTPRLAEMLRSFVASPEFLATRQPDARAPLGMTGAEAEQVLKSFAKYQGPGRPGYVTNFIGGVNSTSVSSGIETLDGLVEDYPIAGNFHGGPLEWVGTLKSVIEANGGFRMLELGAGWGPWCVIGYFAAAQRGISDIKVIAVEGDAGHIRFAEENFAANHLIPESYSIIQGVVGLTDGEASFPVAKDPAGVYGGVAVFSDTSCDRGPFEFFMTHCAERVEKVERVPAYSLARLMADLPVVDLVHCDIQGSELELFTGSIELVSRKVRRVVIGTHSPQIDRGMMGVFATHGWILEGAEDCHYRDGIFNDGTQVWRNPLAIA